MMIHIMIMTWCTSFVSSWVAFSASFVKKSELAFGEGEALEVVEEGIRILLQNQEHPLELFGSVIVLKHICDVIF